MVIISQIVTVITNDSHFLQKGWTTTAWFCSSAMLSVFDFKRAEGGDDPLEYTLRFTCIVK